MILYALFLISSIESSDSFCSIEQCENNTSQVNEIAAEVQHLISKVLNLEAKNTELTNEISRLNIENNVLQADIIEIQYTFGLKNLPPVQGKATHYDIKNSYQILYI